MWICCYIVALGGVFIFLRGCHIALKTKCKNVNGAIYALVGAGMINIATLVGILFF